MPSLALLALGASILYTLILTIYRLYLSPVSHIPGPKLAAATWWYQFYYDVIQQGTYMQKMQSLHAEYGPVIRINPSEVHVSDPAFMDTLYPGHGRTKKRNKWTFYTGVLGTPGASMNTNKHDLHRVRRAALNPFFAKGAIRKLQPLIDAKVDLLLERLEGVRKDRAGGGVVNVNHAMSAFTNDVVTEFCFGKCHDRLHHPTFDPSFHDKAKAGLCVVPLLASFPWVVRALEALPPALGSLLGADYAEYVKEKNEMLAEAKKAMESRESSNISPLAHRTIFHEILDSKLPPEEKTLPRLADEAAVTLAAGTLTTAWDLTVAMYHIVADPSIARKLRAELVDAIPDPDVHTPLPVLENLRYLRGCVQEAIRLGKGVPGRINQIAPEETMTVPIPSTNTPESKQTHIKIPPGTPTSMTVYIVHHNETLFPDSHSFRPERWLQGDARIEKYLFGFGKGTRGCAGINLAYAEMTIALARVFRVYGTGLTTEIMVEGEKGGELVKEEDCRGVLELYQTGDTEVECVGAMVLPRVASGLRGVKMRHPSPSRESPVFLFTTAGKQLEIMIAEIFTLRGGAYLAIAALAIYFVRLQLTSRRDARKALDLGCKPLPSYPDGLNAFGLPILYEFYKADQECEVEQVTIRQLEYLSKKLGREVTTYRISVLGSENIVTADEENIHAVLVSQFNEFTLGPYRCGGFRPLLGEGIFAADGAKWAHSRALLKPQFTRSQMNDLELEDRHVSHLLDSIPSPDKDGWTSHPDFRALFHHYTLDSAMEMLLGVTPGTTGFSTGMADEVDWERLTECVDLSLSMIATRLLLGPFYWIYSTPAFRRCRDEVFAFVDRCVTSALDVANTKRDAQEKPSTAAEDLPSRYVLLDALAEHTSDPIELREQMLNVLLAGRDTTAAFLSYLVILLARHPRVYAKLRGEVLAKFGDGTTTTITTNISNGEQDATTTPITLDSLRACTYLQHVLHETARLYPLVPATKRFAARDTTLPRGGGPDGLSPISVAAGTEVMYHTHALHRSPRLWGADADDYVPERWTGRKLSGRCEYIPFSAGPRVCMGQQLALMKAGYFAVRFVQRFEGVEDLDVEKFGGRIRCQVALGNSPADAVRLRLRVARG
ncbi:hypothetical protein HK57_00589 [Aspergillus ustus]|uniref:Cytochrome P450 n=1 Tax=Aspergillus ustus TaxID=40382 RepID=A0A0C1BVW4_ASPUT|nr:hypothetical protein HK57_00589 [Aspergillus ustus]